MATNPYLNTYIDPNAFSRGVETAGAMQRNNAYAMQMEEARRQREAEDRARAGLAGSMENGYVNPEKAARSVAGDPDAMVAMAEKIKTLDDAKLTTAKRGVNFLGSGLSYIVKDYDKNPDPAKFQAQYTDMRNHAPDEIKKQLPESINPDSAKMMLINAGMGAEVIQNEEMNRKAKIAERELALKERETDIKKTKDLPYKVGQLHDIVVDGKTYQATFHGVDEKGEPMWKNLQVKPEKQEPGDKDLIRSTIKEMPKLKKEAMSQASNVDSIDKALTLLKTGTVTGKSGQLKSFLAPYAEAMGVNTKEMDDAQTFELLTRTIVGPMRLDIIGAGPVSEWEQKLMQKMSGSGGTAQAAAYELLTTYKKLAEDKISNYNSTLEGLIQLNPSSGKIYKPVTLKSKSTQSQAAEGARPSSANQDPIAQLKDLAANGDEKAQSYLKSKGITWQQ